jgi:hypothetical protein
MPNSFPVWLITGRDANRWRLGNKAPLKNRPWLVTTFETEAEARACKIGIQAAIGGMLNNVFYLTNEEGLAADAEFMARNGLTAKPAPATLPPV